MRGGRRSLLRQLILPKLGRLRVERCPTVRNRGVPPRGDPRRRLPRKPGALSAATMFNLATGWELRPDNPATVSRKPRGQTRALFHPCRTRTPHGALASHRTRRARTWSDYCCSPAPARRSAIRNVGPVRPRRGRLTKPAATTKQNKHTAFPSLLRPGNSWSRCTRSLRRRAGAIPWPRRQRPTKYDLKRFWARACAGLPISVRVRLHDLRHSYACYLASAGLSLPVIGAPLGHSSPDHDIAYAHLLDDPLRAATNASGRS